MLTHLANEEGERITAVKERNENKQITITSKTRASRSYKKARAVLQQQSIEMSKLGDVPMWFEVEDGVDG